MSGFVMEAKSPSRQRGFRHARFNWGKDATIPVAGLAHIVQSEAATGGEKDRLFLAAHAEALRGLIEHD